MLKIASTQLCSDRSEDVPLHRTSKWLSNMFDQSTVAISGTERSYLLIFVTVKKQKIAITHLAIEVHL